MSFGVDATTLLSSTSQTTQTDAPTNLRRFANLNLSEDQRTKVRAILQQAKTNGTSSADLQTQINAVLTDAQKTQLQQNVQNAHGDGSGRHRHAAGSGDTSSSSTATLPNGLTEADILNQVLAAGSLVNQQVQASVTTG